MIYNTGWLSHSHTLHCAIVNAWLHTNPNQEHEQKCIHTETFSLLQIHHCTNITGNGTLVETNHRFLIRIAYRSVAFRLCNHHGDMFLNFTFPWTDKRKKKNSKRHFYTTLPYNGGLIPAISGTDEIAWIYCRIFPKIGLQILENDAVKSYTCGTTYLYILVFTSLQWLKPFKTLRKNFG